MLLKRRHYISPTADTCSWDAELQPSLRRCYRSGHLCTNWTNRWFLERYRRCATNARGTIEWYSTRCWCLFIYTNTRRTQEFYFTRCWCCFTYANGTMHWIWYSTSCPCYAWSAYHIVLANGTKRWCDMQTTRWSYVCWWCNLRKYGRAKSGYRDPCFNQTTA